MFPYTSSLLVAELKVFQKAGKVTHGGGILRGRNKKSCCLDVVFFKLLLALVPSYVGNGGKYFSAVEGNEDKKYVPIQ